MLVSWGHSSSAALLLPHYVPKGTPAFPWTLLGHAPTLGTSLATPRAAGTQGGCARKHPQVRTLALQVHGFVLMQQPAPENLHHWGAGPPGRGQAHCGL